MEKSKSWRIYFH